MAQGHHLFFAKKDRILDDEQHLAEMVSLIGPPPAEYLARSEKAAQYWDKQGTFLPHFIAFWSDISMIGNWKGSIPIPEQSLEPREQQFFGEDKELFVKFLRRILRWLPEDRPTAEELAYDDFLMQAVLRARVST